MLVHIPEILSAAEAAECRAALQGAAWVDGRETAGHLSAHVKHNRQLHWQDPTAQRLGAMVAERLQRHPLFLSAALPAQVLPPLFNRYEGGGRYGPHIDGAIRSVEGEDRKIRTDLSMTLMLSEPADYDGGELVIADLAGGRSIKLPAGDAILYPAVSVHEVTPVTRGVRFAAFTWIQSLVRDDGERQVLLELDAAILQLGQGPETSASRLQLTNIYHTLLRRWADL
jgi:PKHD-type hydroxylase